MGALRLMCGAPVVGNIRSVTRSLAAERPTASVLLRFTLGLLLARLVIGLGSC